MKNSMSNIFSVMMIGLGLLSILWVSSSMVGKAHSQQTPAAPTAQAPTAPTMDLPPPPVDTPELGAPPAHTEALVPGFQNPEGYTYDPTGRRDPFRPFGQFGPKVLQAIQVPGANGASPVMSSEPLQQYDLSQLKVVGIVWEIRNPKAMVQDPLGKLHLVLKESKIGRNNGFVAAIREGEVIVVEPTVSEDGMQTANTRVMTLFRK